MTIVSSGASSSSMSISSGSSTSSQSSSSAAKAGHARGGTPRRNSEAEAAADGESSEEGEWRVQGGTQGAAADVDPEASRIRQQALLTAARLPRWTKEEKAEAMALIREIMSMGLDAAELIKSGIRADVVQHCCRELGVPLAGTIPLATPSTSAVDAMRQAAMASRKRKMAPTAIGAPSLDRSLPDAGKRHEHSGTRPRVPHNDVQHSATTGASPGDGSPPEPPLSAPKGPKTMQQQQQKRYRDVDAPSQSAQQLEDEVAQAFLESSEASMTSSLDPRQSRHAGLYYGDDFARGVEAPSGYVDYSAPLPRLEFPPLHRSGTESPGPASRPIATPSNGHVVHANRKGRRRPGTEEVQARVSRASRRRKQPFLPHLNQSIVLDFSDDSSEEEGGGSEETSLKPSSSGLGDDSNKRRKEIRNASTSFIHAAWRKKIELEAEEQQQRRQQLSPAPPSTPTSAAAAAATPRLSSGALALLREKEKEIEALKERMRELERRRVHAESLDLSKTRAAVERDEEADPTHSAVTDAADRGATQEDSQKDAPQEDERQSDATTDANFPAYVSPFTSYPGLRSLLP